MKRRIDCLSEYGSDYEIEKKVASGELFRVGKAVYSETPHVPELAVLSYKHPRAVVTMHSAFYLHGLTDVIPEEYDFATERNASKIKDHRIRQYFVSDDFFDCGVEEMEYHSYHISVYSPERMLVELIRYKSKLPYDYYKEILLNYRRILPSLNMQEIQDYALAAPKSGKIMETLQAEVF